VAGLLEPPLPPPPPPLPPFFRQIFVGDVWAAYGRQVLPASPPDAGSQSQYAFHDIAALTCFADYRLPQLLWTRGALVFSVDLAAAVGSCTELAPGSEEEVEIRAATVQAVERIKALLGGITSVEVDWRLWNRGESELVRLKPHHRTRTVFY
jgi:hypothetical protein